MIQLTEEYRAAARAFKELFGYGVPLSLVSQTETTEGLIKTIQKCLELKKDIIRETYGVKDNGSKVY